MVQLLYIECVAIHVGNGNQEERIDEEEEEENEVEEEEDKKDIKEDITEEEENEEDAEHEKEEPAIPQVKKIETEQPPKNSSVGNITMLPAQNDSYSSKISSILIDLDAIHSDGEDHSFI